jgi:Flp pilus assembly protein TadG
MTKTCKSWKSSRGGAFAVEAALVIGTLLILLFAIFEYARFIMIKQVVDNATREGTRLALAANVNDTNSFNYQTTTTIRNSVYAALGGQDQALTGLTVDVYLADSAGSNIGDWRNADVGQNIAVETNATYTPILPSFGFLPTSVPIFSKCVMRSEGN